MRRLSLAILFLVPLVANAGTPPPGNVLPDLIERVQQGVVNVSSTRFVKQYVLQGVDQFFGMFGIPQAQVQKQSSLGSGFLIDSGGYILTNNHVIENASEIVVTFYDKRRLPAKIVGRDKLLDLALLQLKSAPPNLKPTTLGDSDKVRIGESVFAIGNPFGLQHTVTAGIISAKNRSIGIGPLDNFLQTDCSINFGNSGGPLFNLNGEVIGINSAINAQGQGLGFAIPIDEAKRHLEELKTRGYITRSWLGVMGQDITPALQNYYGLPVEHGVVIERMSEKGPAFRAGLRAGDILVSINGHEILERGDIQREISKVKPGADVKVIYNRRGADREKAFKLLPAPDTRELPDGVF
jgi:serine protease Do